MAMFMETTEVSPSKTVAEIQELLARRGARSVNIEYNRGDVVSVSFMFHIYDQDIPFRLPCRWESVKKILQQCNKKVRKNDTIDRMSQRIAWRQMLRWVQAQLALIEIGMVRIDEVFLPYAIVRDGGVDKSMYEAVTERRFLSLPAPKSNEATQHQKIEDMTHD